MVDLRGRADAWRELADEVGRELVAWREAHPRATLTEIEDAVLAVTERLQARLLTDLAEASAAADPGEQRSAERPRCRECGGELEPSGHAERTVQVQRQRTPLRLRRGYAVCSACGVGLFPSDGRSGIRVAR
jgi:uncharacterized protein with PIN domain